MRLCTLGPTGLTAVTDVPATFRFIRQISCSINNNKLRSSALKNKDQCEGVLRTTQPAMGFELNGIDIKSALRILPLHSYTLSLTVISIINYYLVRFRPNARRAQRACKSTFEETRWLVFLT